MTKLEIWIMAWIEIIDAIARIVTLGYFMPTLSFAYLHYLIRKKAKQAKKTR